MHPSVSVADGEGPPSITLQSETVTINTRPISHNVSTAHQPQQTQQSQQPEYSSIPHTTCRFPSLSPVPAPAPAQQPNLPYGITDPKQHMHPLPLLTERPSPSTIAHIIPTRPGMYIGIGGTNIDIRTARQNLVQQILTFTTLGWTTEEIAAHLNKTGWATVDAEKVREIWEEWHLRKM